MFFRWVLSGVVAMPLCLGGAAMAKTGVEPRLSTPSLPIAAFSGRDLKSTDRPVVLAQADDPRINDLEAQIRDLTGKIEELNFQVLQMQDQMQRMQKDNEFRFQQLEGNSPGTDTTAAPSDKKSSIEPPERHRIAKSSDDPVATTIKQDDDSRLGVPPKTFGTITFDANGNVVDGGLGDAQASGPLEAGQKADESDNTTVAALPPTKSADELYRDSYQFILSGDYKTAERGFREHIKRFPDDRHAADANFWLGEALLGEDRYRDAAEVFLKANRTYPDSPKAPDMLLKLGISLAAMNQRDVACATYGEIGQRYQDISSALKQRIKQERQLAGC